MFDDFNISKFKDVKYPADFSLKALGEIRKLQRTPLDVKFANKYDDIFKTFKNLFNNRTRKFPDKLVKDLIAESQPVILKIKNYHNRKRPNELAEYYNIDLSYNDMKSAKTPAFPSGHSAQSKLIALVLTDMYPEMQKELMQAAQNISKSRILARVHYESDKTMGEKLGESLFNHFKTA
jgi:hypothetical protein|tara:strand:- start:1087 stop:1623 length:537 start_codon:yes stop_codon:yes gene_type:complete